MKAIRFDGKEFYSSKVVCVGRNYVEHIRELNNEIPDEPVIFIKPNSAISNELYSGDEEDIHYEGEITFLISGGEVSGVGLGIDLTKRETQAKLKAKGLPWERAKAFDKSVVFSDFVRFDEQLSDLRMELSINGELRQQGGYELMLYKPEQLLEEVNTFLSLEDGDLLMTGTPKGVGVVNQGDEFIGRVLANEKLLLEKTWIVM